METLVISVSWMLHGRVVGGFLHCPISDQNEDCTELEAELASSNSARKAAVESPDDPSCL